MRLTYPLTFLLLAGALLWASSAEGTIKPSVRVTPAEDFATPQAGDLYQGRFDVLTDQPGAITNVRVSSEGWNVLSSQAMNVQSTKQGNQFELQLTALPRDVRAPLVITFDVGHHAFRRELHLGPVTSAPLVSRGDAGVAGSKSGDFLRVPLGADTRAPGQDTGDASVTKDRSIRVRGTLAYDRDDGTLIGADGMKFTVFDDDIFDGVLATGVTDADGDFDVTFTWAECPLFCEADPDIYVKFESVNSKVDVKKDLFNIYSFVSSTQQDYTGTNLNFGTLTPTSETDHAALGIMTNFVRTWRWVLGDENLDIPKVAVYFPSEALSTSFYNPFLQEIHIHPNHDWNEFVHIHEYGHHFINHFGDDEPVEYCNNICDPDFPNECGHCIWCQEREFEAWTEGWPNWFAAWNIDQWAADYGVAALNPLNVEPLNTCSGTLDVPLLTEGFLTAVLWDMSDGANEDDPLTPGFSDALALGADEIFDITTGAIKPNTPSLFFSLFQVTYPQHNANFWETTANNNFALDSVDPALVTNLSSASHPVGQDSPDTTPTFTWTAATDDFSGVGGYSVTITASPSLPNATQDIGAVTSYTADPTTPGIYYFNIRSVDRAGNWDNTAASYGPFEIRAPSAANLEFADHTGWAEYVVPRSDDTATSSSVPAAISLFGNTSSTYWNLRGINSGESSTGVGYQGRCYVDGIWRYWVSFGARNPGASFWTLNQGPFEVRGGRHTFESRVDALEEVAETDEADNDWAKQWIWIPQNLFLDRHTRSAPPERTGGWDAIPTGITQWFNCDGFRYFWWGEWNAVYIRALDDDDDYDVRQHPPMTSVVDGFTTNRGFSSRSAGLLDAVFMRSNVPDTSSPTDVGVLNTSSGNGSYEIVNIQSLPVTYDTPVTLSLAQGDYMLLADVDGIQTGLVSVKVDVGAGNDPVHVGWLDSALNNADMHDFTQEAVTDAQGVAWLDLNITATGDHAVVVWRDPAETSSAVALNVQLEVGPTPADLVPYETAGWHSPIVPLPDTSGTPSSVPLPAQLQGDAASYVNFLVRNEGPVTAGFFHQRIYLDGLWHGTQNRSSLAANTSAAVNDWARTIRGGRHTLVLDLDGDFDVEEKYEDNNIYGEQWVWQPVSLIGGLPTTRSDPPGRTQGWDNITSGEPKWYNADGLRSPTPTINGEDGWWSGVAVLAADAGEADVRIHEVDTGAKNGFRTNLAFSTWSAGLSDFVLMNFRNTAIRPFDVGVLRGDGDLNEPYTAVFGSSGYLGQNPVGTNGPFSIGASHILNIHEIELPVSQFTFDLVDVSGSSIDWGMSLYDGSGTYFSKSSAMPGTTVWTNGSGAGESFTVEITTPGKYCLAVWKVGSADLPLSGDYTLQVSGVATSVGGSSAPRKTALTSVHPNPFNPRTTISFELDRSGAVDLAVYDLRGERVRDLASGHREAGHYDVVWDGLDNRGRFVSTGVYLARLRTGELELSRKMVLLK